MRDGIWLIAVICAFIGGAVMGSSAAIYGVKQGGEAQYWKELGK